MGWHPPSAAARQREQLAERVLLHSLADATAREQYHPTPGATLLLTAFLTRHAVDAHGGAFAVQRRSMKRAIGTLIRESPGLCRLGTSQFLHVVHDQPDTSNASAAAMRGVVLHAVAPERTFQPVEARWLHFERLLRAQPAGSWACAFAVDLSDVRLLRPPPCAALNTAAPPGTKPGAPLVLVLGSDYYSNLPIQLWLMQRAHWTRFNETWDQPLWTRHILARSTTARIYNAGIVGGGRAVVSWMVRRMAAPRARRRSSVGDVHSAGA